MTREEAVALLERYSNYDGMGIPNLAGCKEAMKVAVESLKEAFPELRESEDEKIRKWILEYLHDGLRKTDEQFKEQFKVSIAWLEKQKEPVVDKEGMYYYLGGKFIYCGYPATEENPYDFAMSQQEKEQKEEEGYEAIPVESTLEYKLGFKAGKESEKQKESTWTEDDENGLQQCIKIVVGWEKDYDIAYSPYSNFLKSLPERFNLQPKQEWSEEDEHRMTDAIYFLESAKIHYADTSEIEKTIAWLKSLRPQYYGDVTMTEAYKMGLETGKASSWKPSEEQMEHLQRAINYYESDWGENKLLRSLINNLKKLI